MKRYILAGLLLAGSFGLIINMTSAQMVGDVDPGTDSTTLCTNLTYNLKLGSRDSSTNGQVTMLQEFLVMKGLLLVDPTGYFGPATLAAAKAYQSQAGLLTSGYVGPLTRAAIKTASCGNGTSVVTPLPTNPTQPVITSISKTSASVGETVTVYGRNLKDGLYVSWGGANGSTFNPSSVAADGNSFTFVVPNATPGIYEISANKRGDNASYSVINTVSFTVLSTTYTCPNGTTSHTPCSTSSVVGTIDAASGIATDSTTGSRKFVITGTVTGVNVIGISIGNTGGKLYGSGHFSVTGQGYRHEIPATASLPFNPGQYTVQLYTENSVLLATRIVSVTETGAPAITLTPDTTTTFGGTTTLTWNVTPPTNVSCVSAGGNLANGTYMNTSGSWTTPNLYTTTQYGMKCTNYTNGLSTTKYVTVTVTPKTTTGTAPVITLSPDTSVAYGGNSTITWSVTPSTGVSCVSAGGNLANGTYMSTAGSWTTPNLYTTTEYGMRCTDTASGLSSYKYTTVNVTQASAPQITLSPDTTTTFGGTATITWSVTPSTGVSCVSAGGNLANGTYMSTSGSWTTPNLYTTTQYGMRCTSTNGLSSIKFVNVSVPSQTADSTSSSAPTITLTPDQTISYGGTANLSWNVTPSTGIRCESAGGNLASGTVINASGSWTTPTLYTNTQYGMRCVNTSNGLTTYKYTNVYVATPAAPSVTLTSDKAIATYGGTATLSWSATPSTNVTCVAAGGNIASGTTAGASGSWTTSPLYTTTQYGLRCTNQTNGLSTTKYVTVSVASQAPTSASAPVVTVSSNVTIPYGGNTTLRWSVTPTTNVSCLVAGGNLTSGTSAAPSGYWTTPNLYTTTQYGIQCTDSISGYSTIKYVTVTVSPQTTTSTTTSSPDACAALDASLYCTTESCTTNTGTVRYGTKNCAVDACAALDASQYCTTQSCTTNTGVVRYGTKSCPTSSMSGAIFAANNTMSSVLGASTQCVDLPVNMHRGYESYGVTRLQEFLKSKNFIGEVTGFYGDKTVAAVKEYQSTRGLPQTGMVYDFTRAAVKADTCQ